MCAFIQTVGAPLARHIRWMIRGRVLTTPISQPDPILRISSHSKARYMLDVIKTLEDLVVEGTHKHLQQRTQAMCWEEVIEIMLSLSVLYLCIWAYRSICLLLHHLAKRIRLNPLQQYEVGIMSDQQYIHFRFFPLFSIFALTDARTECHGKHWQ